MPYIQAYMSLHNEDAAGENSKLMMQRQGEKPKICPDDANEKQREEKEYMANLALPPPPPGLLPHLLILLLGLWLHHRMRGDKVILEQSLPLPPHRAPNLDKEYPLQGQCPLI